MTREERFPRQRAPRSPLTLRLISAAVLIPVALAVTALGGGVFALFVALAAAVMAREWVRICAGRPAAAGEAGLIAGVLAAAALAAFWHPLAALLAGAGGAAISAHGAAEPARDGRARGFWLAFGGLYLSAAVTATLWLRAEPGGYAAFMWLLLLVWSTDTGAYAFGRLIGGPAFVPRFSPSKTWAGVGGGILAAVAAGLLAAEIGLHPEALGPGRGEPLWPYAVLFALAAQTGDILESAAKRHFGVKDSGTLIPGHGGVLDRMDGYLLAVCVAALCALLHADGG
ncbi:MAG: phosphatidate cytidylyltransferase [Alphaproteobacteria bacterium]